MQKETGVHSKEIPAAVERLQCVPAHKRDIGLNLQQEPELEAILPQLKLVN